ncbi:hypothetical protein KEM56_003681 [Ascosphaera pollenicola]|nr:hypothetical protein KEM56_003681 [Ascosphaera pollenicola]
MKNSSKPWADQPLPLVETPFHATKETDVYTQGASQMALLHNAILRGFNTIYLQAPHVQPKDYRDFIGYSLTWCKFVKKHHDDEEARLFPSVESAMGVIGALDHSREEHHTFMHGLTKFNTYLASLFNANRTAEFSGARLVSIMDSFKKAFCHHFHHEIDHIADLRDLTEAICAEHTAEVGAIFAAWGRNSIRGVGVSDIFSFILMNFDRTAENGIWKDWPPNMPAPIRWILINVGGAWNSNYWKFSSCTSDGRPRTLDSIITTRHAQGQQPSEENLKQQEEQ